MLYFFPFPPSLETVGGVLPLWAGLALVNGLMAQGFFLSFESPTSTSFSQLTSLFFLFSPVGRFSYSSP